VQIVGARGIEWEMEGASRLRLALLALLVGLVSVVIGLRLYQVQWLMSERFRIRAEDQHQSRREVPAVRGAILDRRGQEFAASVEALSLYAHPERVENPDEAAETLAPLLNRSQRDLAEVLSEKKSFAYIERFLAPQKAEEIRATTLEFGGKHPFGLESTHQRVYPNGRLGVHVVGFANIDGKGVEGIEREFDEELRGDPAVYLVFQDAHSGEVRQLIRAPQKEPQDVVLTLDLVLQHVVERELDRAMRTTRSRAASAILLDPATGEILALANRPAADLNHYSSSSDEEKKNRALIDFYEPGSTFKVVTMAAALDHECVRPGQSFYCERGTYRTGSRVFHDIGRYGYLTLSQVLEKSSNIGMVKVARNLTDKQLYGSVIDFGFGSKTGVELPGESAGRLAPLEKWSGFTHDSMAFGQEIAVTVLQMVSAVATIANDGMQVPPRVVLGTQDKHGRFTPRLNPQPRRVISSEAAQQLTKMMERVIDRGTGTLAAVPGYRIAGKSGTAQLARKKTGYSQNEFMASFCGFGPLGAPRLAALVLLDSPRGDLHGGGEVAAPVFSRIFGAALRHLRVPATTDPTPGTLLAAERAASQRTRSESQGPVQAGVVPDLRGLSLRDAVSLLAAHGYGARVSGRGFVAAQDPAPGERLAPGQSCELRLRATAQRPRAPRGGSAGREAG
jgi:cell division protein FtsI (penicillin-binding protein 3)